MESKSGDLSHEYTVRSEVKSINHENWLKVVKGSNPTSGENHANGRPKAEHGVGKTKIAVPTH